MNASTIESLLRQQIVSGHVEAGERLPAGRELAKRFGVARGTVRAALKQLEESGFVSRRSRIGTFVTYSRRGAQNEFSNLASPLAVLDARIALEPHTARLAAARAGHIDRTELQDINLWCDGPGSDAQNFAAQEEQFHMALARCAGNPIIRWMMGMLQREVSTVGWRRCRAREKRTDEIARHLREHRAIADAICAGDGERASRLMEQHLVAARSALMATLSEVS